MEKLFKKLDMAFGNPEFLHPIWSHIENEVVVDLLPGRYTIGSRERIKKEILNLHKKVHGINTDEYHVIVGYGATNVLGTLIQSISSISQEGVARVYSQRPHYSRFPSITRLYGGKWVCDPHGNVEIITSPNNPTGEPQTPTTKAKYKIFDYSYNWPHYTNEVEPLDKNIMVFSLAKITGHADLRIGWALIKKTQQGEVLRKEFEDLMEFSFNGLSKQAQQAAEELINIVSCYQKTFFTRAKEKLDDRWNKINSLNLPFKILNSQGMFLFCEGDCPKDIEGINGIDFYDHSSRFRLNIGCDDKTFNEFIRRYNGKK